MFRNGLLISTAMTAVALLLSGAPAQAQTDMHVASRDPNTRFLCNYGQFLVSASSAGSSSLFTSNWQHVAVPVNGHGQMVHRIKVVQAWGNYTRSSTFKIGIYSNTESGFPGNAIAVGTGKSPVVCGPVTVSIPPTKLKRNKTYWIEETVSGSFYSPTNLYWEASPTIKRKAYVQHHWRRESSQGGRHSSSYTSPWTKQTSGPYLKLK